MGSDEFFFHFLFHVLHNCLSHYMSVHYYTTITVLHFVPPALPSYTRKTFGKRLYESCVIPLTGNAFGFPICSLYTPGLSIIVTAAHAHPSLDILVP